MFPLFTFFNYETVPVYCLHSISTACLILVEKSKVLDAAAAQSWFIEKVFGVPTIQSRVNYTIWSLFRLFLLVANTAFHFSGPHIMVLNVSILNIMSIVKMMASGWWAAINVIGREDD